MKYRALVSFSGLVTMSANEIKEIEDDRIAKDLLSCNYIEKAEKDSNDKSKKEDGEEGNSNSESTEEEKGKKMGKK